MKSYKLTALEALAIGVMIGDTARMKATSLADIPSGIRDVVTGMQSGTSPADLKELCLLLKENGIDWNGERVSDAIMKSLAKRAEAERNRLANRELFGTIKAILEAAPESIEFLKGKVST